MPTNSRGERAARSRGEIRGKRVTVVEALDTSGAVLGASEPIAPR